MSDAIMVFTAKSEDTLIGEGGSASWRLDRNHARHCEYVVCTRNAHADHAEGDEPHHCAFLIGRIRDVVLAEGESDRFLIRFSEYARIQVEDAWKGDRNPVRYISIDELDIDPAALAWRRMPSELERPAPDTAVPASGPMRAGEVVADARRSLARAFGVPLNAIEITIRC